MTQQTAHKERLLTLPFLGICLVNLLVFVNFHALLPIFPFYITALGGDALAIGLATALFSIASILSRPFVGWLVDTRGRRLILLAGLAGLLVKSIGYDVMFLCMILPCVCSVAYYHLFGRRHASSFNRMRSLQDSSCKAAAYATGSTGVQSLPLVITISRQFGSGGHRIGKMLAQRLGIPFYDRQLIALTAQSSGLTERLVQQSEQTVDSMLMYDDPAQSAVFYAQCRVIRDLVEKQSCVIVGRLANFVLRERPDCVHIFFIYADRESRLQRITATQHISREEAEELMTQTDKARAQHCLQYTGHEWTDINSYHLMIDSAMAGSEAQVVDTICAALSARQADVMAGILPTPDDDDGCTAAPDNH